MQTTLLPDQPTMYKALVHKDSSYEGIFFAAIKTTGIFCRPTCTARKPKKENVEYYATAKEALAYGYRPCKVCTPLSAKGNEPEWITSLLKTVNDNPEMRIKDYDLRAKGVDPSRVRRWFKKNHGMTFQSYQRALRINKAFGSIKHGGKVTHSAFDSGYDSLSGFGDTFKKATGFAPVDSKHQQLIAITRILTPLGPMIAGAIDHKICLLEFTDRRMLETQLERIKKYYKANLQPGNDSVFDELNQQLDSYFNGQLKNFKVPLSTLGTAFQQRVWTELQNIPYGESRSYKEQAIALGNVKAIRAVATANGDNRIAIIIPCHRVIGADGSMVGYGGGIWRKQWLLTLEQKKSVG